MKWLSSDDWRDAFRDVLDLHLLPACEAAGIKVEEIPSLLNENYFMSTVWGCAFEDFLTRETEHGRNIVDDYLKHRGWHVNTHRMVTPPTLAFRPLMPLGNPALDGGLDRRRS